MKLISFTHNQLTFMTDSGKEIVINDDSREADTRLEVGIRDLSVGVTKSAFRDHSTLLIGETINAEYKLEV